MCGLWNERFAFICELCTLEHGVCNSSKRMFNCHITGEAALDYQTSKPVEFLSLLMFGN
jgi:hypothetical protein